MNWSGQFIAYFKRFSNVFQRNKEMSFMSSKSYQKENILTTMTLARDVSTTPAISKMEIFVTLCNG